MLETEEVDIDYFTPSSSTSLSKIFSKNIQTEEGQENSTLKYVSPLPALTQKLEDEKPTQQVLYVATVNAYEWLKDSYLSKEKIGFVIINLIKSGLHNIILYDSNKTILSTLTLTTASIINIRENVSISFYDNQKKYWSVYTSTHDLSQISDILKGLQVDLKYVDTKKNISQSDDVNTRNLSPVIANQATNDSKESDTDSSVNRRTKDSILKRMATMGQSVLPPTHPITQTSDSSDQNDSINQHKSRHKPHKNINKRNIEKNSVEIDNNIDLQIKIAPKPLLSPKINKNVYQNTDQQIVTMQTMEIVKSPVTALSEGNDMNIFMSEQRVSNSELRINMSRMTDKLDLVLEKVKCLKTDDKCSVKSDISYIQNEITIKLLNEYEKKIKNYEAFISSKGFNCDTFEPKPEPSDTHNIKETKQLCNCKQLCESKDKQISQLKEEVQTLIVKLEEKDLKNNESSLSREISELKEHIITQIKQINDLNKKIESAQSLGDAENKIKSIMNDTFQSISTNFDSDLSYSGAVVKSKVASIIKKTTMACLKDL